MSIESEGRLIPEPESDPDGEPDSDGRSESIEELSLEPDGEFVPESELLSSESGVTLPLLGLFISKPSFASVCSVEDETVDVDEIHDGLVTLVEGLSVV